MFITVLHGEHMAEIFNIHCNVQNLLDCIKRHCGCEDEEEIELADVSGQVKNLLKNKHRSAAELLEGRETYVLLGVTTISKVIVQLRQGGQLPLNSIVHGCEHLTELLNTANAKLATSQEQKSPSPRMKSRRSHKKSTLDIPAAGGLRTHSPQGSRARTPIASPKQSVKLLTCLLLMLI